ncbi:hypothetical protein [Blautia massiliensis]|uniref:hypothetical protein n=1 Tax=Blautia massiliensis (ex Durand et al. 2017) TaxID=1737424 RepID=UPI002431BD6F|nr:hypothetical protein [Blautia massiliensis (ex Durand et al. 2017)]
MATQPIFLCVDDTMVAKAGTRFENVSKLFDHAAHNGSNYLNGHCFVSIMLCIPVWKNDRISYLSLPLGYRMWQKKESKLELAASMQHFLKCTIFCLIFIFHKFSFAVSFITVLTFLLIPIIVVIILFTIIKTQKVHSLSTHLKELLRT